VACLRPGRDVTIVCYGILVNHVLDAAEMLSNEGIDAEILKLGCVHPVSVQPVLASLRKTGRLIAVEDVCSHGCVGDDILRMAETNDVLLRASALKNLGDGIIPHGAPTILYEKYGLDAVSIAETAKTLMNMEKSQE
jgi:1-deoxy-D-xylulose-5-phosphate synthase